MSFTEVFGGNTIYPAEPDYLALSLTENVTLEWPIEQAITGNVLAKIIDVTPDAAGRVITLPDARQGSLGYATTFYNAGADTFTVKDAAGGTVLTVASGEAWDVYLRSNTTLAGAWRIFQMGAGTSSANAATLAGAGLVAITTTLNEEMEVSTKSANYAILDADRAKVMTWTGGSGTFTLPNPATVGTNWFVWVKNRGTGSVTLTPSSGTIDGSSSLILATDESTALVSDGTNWSTVGLGQETNSVFDFISIDVSGSGNFTLTGAQLNRVSYEFTGILTGNRNIIVPASVQQYWVDNQTSGAFTLTVKAVGLDPGVVVPQGQRRILYCDGTNVIAAETFIVSTPVDVTQGGTGLTSVAQGDLLYGSAADTYSLLNKNTSATRYLSNTGASNNPAWAQVNLSNGVTGTLPTGNGGTGLTTYNQGDIIYASAANTLSALAKDTNATRYLSNTGTSNNPAWAQVSLTTGVTGTLPLGNGGTGQTTANAALNALLPSQTGNSGKFLTTDGSNTSWGTPGVPSGGTLVVQAGTYWDFNLFLAMGSPAGAGTYNVEIPAGAVFRSSNPRQYVFDTSGFTVPSTINITNLGYMVGCGGRGGRGSSAQTVGDDNFAYQGLDATDGGSVIQGPGAGNTLNVTNASGFIWGGGGGGGGGGLSIDNGNNIANGGGGGGGAGFGVGGQPGGLVYAETITAGPGSYGQDGTLNYDASDSKGSGGAGDQTGSATGGAGGDGGDFGVAGVNGTAPTGQTIDVAAGFGGLAGKAININGATVNVISGGASPHLKGAVS